MNVFAIAIQARESSLTKHESTASAFTEARTSGTKKGEQNVRPFLLVHHIIMLDPVGNKISMSRGPRRVVTAWCPLGFILTG
jgi:hypothetical protein